ncbi:MAG TPA: sulfite exporter TauE/SafE family protein [Pirellulales bacterium]|jgi:hypothetical protein
MFFTPANAVWFIAVGAGTGILGALLGTGGGVFLIPILVLGFNVPMHYAVATSIVTVIATSCAVASANVERGTANMRLGMTLEIATSLGAIAGGLTVAHLDPKTLEALFALVLLPTCVMMWRGKTENAERSPDEASDVDSRPIGDRLQNGESKRSAPVAPAVGLPSSAHFDPALGWLGGRYFDPQQGAVVAYRIRRLPGGLAISLAAGLLSGLLGIGGGVFKVPALHLMCGMPIKAAAATSNFMIGVTATASAFLYFGRGEVRPALTATVVLGVFLGSVIGTYLNRYVRSRSLNRWFAVLLLAVAVQMFIRVLNG